jgi:DNA polymerase-3 subunit gamma/tau
MLAECLRALCQQDAAVALHIMTVLQSEGHEATGIARALLEGLRHLIVLKTVPRPEELIPLSEVDIETLRAVAALASIEEIYGQFHILSAAEQTLRHASNPFLGLEMTLVRMACIGRVQPLQTILEHLQRLETGLPAASVPAAAEEERPAAVPARLAHNGQAEEAQTSARNTGASGETPAATVPDMSPTETSQSVVLSTAEGLWEALQQRVTERRPPLGGHMQHGRPLTLDEHKLVIGFANKFSLEYLREPENLVVLRDAAQTLLGRSCNIVLEPSDVGGAQINGTPETGTTAERQTSALGEVQRQKNELKQAVIDIFGATPI